MNFAVTLSAVKRQRRWSDSRLTHELRTAGVDASLDTVKSWVYGRRIPAGRVQPVLETFLKEQAMTAAPIVQQVKVGFRVTSKVLDHVEQSEESQKQIAVSLPLGGTADQPVTVRFTENSDAALLLGGDTRAIWRVHVENQEFFDRLYALLSLFPDEYIWFDCFIET